MFGLSFWEIGIVLVIALVVLGPSKLPELARSLGKGLREFRRAADDLRTTVEDEAYAKESPAPPKNPALPAPGAAPVVEVEVPDPVASAPVRADDHATEEKEAH